MKTSLSIYAGRVTASTSGSRTLGGDIVLFGVPGRTSAGLLKVRAGALRFPDDLTRVKLTKEHNRDESRGYLQAIEFLPDRIRAAAKVSDGPLGDAALGEALDKTRDGFSFDVVDAVIEGDEIVDALVIAIGQVGIPAYDDTRIDSIAASQTPAPPAHTPGEPMNEEQRARLKELLEKNARTAEEETEFQTLADIAIAEASTGAAATPPAEQAPAAPAPAVASVAASFGSVPSGVPAGQQRAQVTERGGALEAFYAGIVDAYSRNQPTLAISAALADVTYSQHGNIIQQPAWSGELWSGVDLEPEWSDLFSTGDMLSLSGEGWRFTTKPEIKDYAGDKAAIPTTTIGTERVPWVGARMAVGNDFDRAFYDFPNLELIRSYVEFVRKDWRLKLDTKIKNYTLANATPLVGVAAQPTLLKAGAKLSRGLKRRKVGKMSFLVANDDDFDTLMDITKNDVPAFLELYGVEPKDFRSSPDVPQGTVIGGVKQAAQVRTLPGSPIRADAQNIANGGIDTAFFGYWAIQEHHDAGIASVQFTAPVEV